MMCCNSVDSFVHKAKLQVVYVLGVKLHVVYCIVESVRCR